MSKSILIGISAFVFILVIVVIVVAATRGGKKTGPKPLIYPKEPVTLTYWRLFDDEDVFKEAFQEYKSMHPNVTIKYVKKDYETYEEDLLNALAAGTGPDIFMLRHDILPKHLDKLAPAPQGFNLIQQKKRESKKDLPTQFKQLFVKAAYDDLVFGDKVYGVPLWVDSLGLFYNPELFEKAIEEHDQILRERARRTESEAEQEKIAEERRRIRKLLSSSPKTWDDFIEVVKLLTKKDAKGNVVRAGIAMGGDKNTTKGPDILSLLMLQNNTQMTTADKKTATFNLSVKKTDGSIVYPGTSALEFYTSFANQTKETYTWNKTFPDSVTAFGEKKAAMMFHYSYITQTLTRKYPELQFQIAPMPQIKRIMERVDYSFFWGEVVSKNTKYPLVAWDFLKFLSSKEAASQYTRATKRPTALLETAKGAASQSKTAYLEEYEGIEVFNAQAYTATNWYKGGEPYKVWEVFQNMIEATVERGQPSQAAIDAAAASVTNILGEAEPLIEREKKEP